MKKENINLMEWSAEQAKKNMNAHGFIVIGKPFDAESAITGTGQWNDFFEMVGRYPNSQEEFDMWCELTWHGQIMYADVMSRP